MDKDKTQRNNENYRGKKPMKLQRVLMLQIMQNITRIINSKMFDLLIKI